MAKASDNAFPSLLITEGTEPAAPAAGKQRLYIDSTTHKLKRTDSGGVDVTIEGAGSVATDAIWDAAGDLAVGSGADTAAKLVKGNAGGTLAMGNAAVIWNAGTAFPASKAVGDRYWRTDVLGGMGFIWDGTNWVSEHLYNDPIGAGYSVIEPFTATTGGNRLAMPWAGLYSIWAIDFYLSFFVNSGGTALGASHKWVCTLVKQPAGTTIATVNIDSGASSAWRNSGAVSIAAAIATTEFELEVVSTKTGTPGNPYILPRLTYRIIAT